MSIAAGQSALAPVTFRVIRECSTHPPCPPSPSPQPEVPLSDTHRPIPLCVDSALIVGAVVEGRAHSPCPPSMPSVDWPARQHLPCPGGQHTIAMPLKSPGWHAPSANPVVSPPARWPVSLRPAQPITDQRPPQPPREAAARQPGRATDHLLIPSCREEGQRCNCHVHHYK